jgi:hypothetical protein
MDIRDVGCVDRRLIKLYLDRGTQAPVAMVLNLGYLLAQQNVLFNYVCNYYLICKCENDSVHILKTNMLVFYQLVKHRRLRIAGL